MSFKDVSDTFTDAVRGIEAQEWRKAIKEEMTNMKETNFSNLVNGERPATL